MLPHQHMHRSTSRPGAIGYRRAGGPQAQHWRVSCKAWSGREGISDRDCVHLEAAATLSQSATGITQPHPNAACILVGPDGRTLAEAYQRAQGTPSAEVLAVAAAGGAARGATAYLNLECGDCHGEAAAVEALLRGGVGRVVVGLRHPLKHLRYRAVSMLHRAGIRVDVLADELAIGRNGITSAAAAASAASAPSSDSSSVQTDTATVPASPSSSYSALSACLTANEALLHRAVLRRPLGVLKYAMTLDGKIATNLGHSAWVSSPQSRGMVFEMRSRSDAVIVGGNTVRRDNPRLTTRREGGHTPARVVMSRTLDLPEDANLWDVSLAPTIVLTQRGARTRFQSALRAAGVEVVEFDFLTPECVADYCQERGFLQCFWECGGTLAAPTIASGVVHKVMAFVAPKIIGGHRAPTPVGELGFVEMTQAVELVDTAWSQVGPDLMITGYMPSSGGLYALEASLEAADEESAAEAAATPTVHLPSAPASPTASSPASPGKKANDGAAATSTSASKAISIAAKRRRGPGGSMGRSVAFYKAWDQWGALSNFSPHPILMPVEAPLTPPSVPCTATAGGTGAPAVQPDVDATSTSGCTANPSGTPIHAVPSATTTPSSSPSSASTATTRRWASVEHYYQAQKFSGDHHRDAADVMEAIAAAPSPEEAARIGRRTERTRPELLRRDWATSKVDLMLAALRVKFRTHAGPRAMLLATAGVNVAATEAGVAAGGTSTSVTSISSASSINNGGGGAALDVAECGSSGGTLCYELVEASPHDYYWGAGYERTGQNRLGRLLMQVRDELLAEMSATGCNMDNTWHLNDGVLGGTAAASAAAPASRG